MELLLYYNMFLNDGVLKVEGFIVGSNDASQAFFRHVVAYAQGDYWLTVTGENPGDASSLNSLSLRNFRILRLFESDIQAALARYYGSAYAPALARAGLDALVEGLYKQAYIRAAGNAEFTYVVGQETELNAAYQSAVATALRRGQEYKDSQALLL